ncbi:MULTISPECIES: 50S ribosomal protein L25/general stress protein Ctc [Devosia]|mgnify:CR=1 FL=1|uniref:Large ribosomal subunit protein bL25 n=1 Tax=Devosia equisanguinis TaxID=2490941 RepID=A0A447IDQ4_9HYPH|nr:MULTISPECIES: 50S ribosomal protein L25/general stress protein Ctc [Devosia]ODT49724.1 MAG: 50S ribosomal protein L25/general stress protein Ctc [Pelagibacterium sp. SCN 63-126]ODU87735.1 MAG: 50S ribosomal protein L25/general stress protein Ctc [Pelagibacterium sp. SCN 63-17]OJX45827.1 MAG: 50S ribosomal protein L25/general stress protein Ctc [Devosia sp. 63-57]VDS05579.1 50S ribosomal protein L25 [Devosia equisanguinis]
MAETKVLKAQARNGVGKGAAREARRQGLVPAVIYGDKKPPVTVSVAYKDAHKAIYAGGFKSHVLNLDVDGTIHKVIPRDYQLDVVKDQPMHIDFLRVSGNAKLTVEVHVNFVNDEKSPGLKRGGTLNVVRHTVEVLAPANAIPDEITVDLSGYEIGDSIHISAVTLPKGVTPTITDRDFTIATVVAPSALKSAGDEGEEEAASEE